MKYVLLTLLMLFVARTAQASTNIEISGNSEGSTSNVSVSSNTSSSNNSSNTSESKTDIRVETNGEVKEYHGTGNNNVTVESSNGQNKVTVTNQANISNHSPSPSPSPSHTASTSASPSASPNIESLFKDDSEWNFFEYMKQKFAELFKIFGD